MTKRFNRRGIVEVWVATMSVVLIGVLGLSVDMGYLEHVGQELQVTADAAALAGAGDLSAGLSKARQASVNVAVNNYAAGSHVKLGQNLTNDPNGDVVIGNYDPNTRVFTPGFSSPNAVMVNARRTAASLNGAASLFFGPIFGINKIDISRTAVATVAQQPTAGLIVLNPVKSGSLNIFGNPTIDLQGRGAQVDSASGTAFTASGNAQLLATQVNIVGGYSFGGNAGVAGGPVDTGQPTVLDPLAYLPTPPYSAASDLGTAKVTGTSTTLNPGYYSGGITVGNNGSATLNPGIYVVGGAGLNVSSNGNLTAKGVMFYVVGTGSVNISGTGVVNIMPPNPTKYVYPGATTYAGVSFFQARDNASPASITGNANFTIEGTLYFSDALINLSGTGTSFGTHIIADTIKASGNGTITLTTENEILIEGSGPPAGIPYLVQ